MTMKKNTLTRETLYALERGIEANSINVARSAISNRDPIFAWCVRRRLRRLLERARLQTENDEPTHVMRLASLNLLDVNDAERQPPEVTSRSYEETVHPELRPLKKPNWTASIALLCLVIALAVSIFRYIHRPFDPHDDTVSAFLESSISDFTLGVFTPKTELIEQRLRSEEAKKLVGAEVTEAVLTTFDRGRAAATANESDLQKNALQYTQSQQALNQLLVRREIPLFVDGSLFPQQGRLSPLLMTYYVEQDEQWKYRDSVLRVVSGWRMDELRIAIPALGYVRDNGF
jgi:hypothetical protein